MEHEEGKPVLAEREGSLLESGQYIRHHGSNDCSGKCCLHGTSPYEFCRKRRQWREDRQILEHVCEHGVGHPCPAGMDYAASRDEELQGVLAGIHGCDGCCPHERHVVEDDDDTDNVLSYLLETVHSLEAKLATAWKFWAIAAICDALLLLALIIKIYY